MAEIGMQSAFSPQASYWRDEIAAARRRYETFWTSADRIVNRYNLERGSSEQPDFRDKYNILYSSTETIKPSLYNQTPKVQAVKRFRDTTDNISTLAVILSENVTQYLMEEIDFDDILKSCVSDYILAGIGNVWLEYEATFSEQSDGLGGVQEVVDYEGVKVDYVHYRDMLYGPAKVWQSMPWVGRRQYFSYKQAVKRFGEKKAQLLQYTHNRSETRLLSLDGTEERYTGAQAIVYQIWHKDSKRALWYSDEAGELLDERDDPLRLKNFFPCPRPMRAVTTTSRFVPKAYYAQYQSQAEELDNLTRRIRNLTDAIKVRGVYDGSNETLTNLLNGDSNKMVAIENWAQFAGQGGINGNVQWVPIKDIATVLTELYRQRDIVKNEIYEISGFSDIVRGVSKASETLGAQRIKADWAGGRLRDMQTEVQRFCRDIIRLINEIAFENFSDETLMQYSGFQLSQDQIEQANMQAAQAMQSGLQLPNVPSVEQRAIQMFSTVAAKLRNEKSRCSLIGIETDSTILPDEQKEREDRMSFLSAIGAYLQQAGPMAMQYPDMRGLLGSIMMFAVNTFKSARPIEMAFDEFARNMQENPPKPEGGDEKANAEKAEQAKLQAAQMQVQAKQQLEATASQERIQLAQIKSSADVRIAELRRETEQEKLSLERDMKERELELREREVRVKERELDMEDENETVRLGIEIAKIEGQNAEIPSDLTL